jgi:hypothetical protein
MEGRETGLARMEDGLIEVPTFPDYNKDTILCAIPDS